MMLKNILKSIFDLFVVYTYGNIFRHITSKRAILCYHRLCKQKYCSIHSIDTTFLNVDLFENHLKWLSKFATFVSLDEIMDFNNNKDKKWKIAITFDDGYRDILLYGIPILEKYKAPAHIFVSTIFVEDPSILPWWDLLIFISNKIKTDLKITIGRKSFFYDFTKDHERIRFLKEMYNYFFEMGPKEVFDAQNYLIEMIKNTTELPLNEILRKEEIKRLAKSKLITFGAHTITHANLAKCSPTEVEEEIITSKKKLESWTEKKINWFAYPYGQKQLRNKLIIEKIKKANFKGALTTDAGYVTKNTNPFEIPRIGIDGNWNMRRFCSRILMHHKSI
ncbi:MAG: polysaccharide deacetylase family protein [Desulfonauticus sp.]|nr:polysaccharide deacetylase family protein [Desulfonauticus sp.]